MTCEMVGTKPDDVKKSLGSVFHPGKIWGCIVLLDAAEVSVSEENFDRLGS